MAEDIQAVQSQLEEIKAAGLDWAVMLRLFEMVKRYGPVAVELIRQLIEFWQDPSSVPRQLAAAEPGPGVGSHCDHKAACLQVLRSALCTAHCAAQHYQLCCEEEHK